jgi:hypothetical protein
MKYKNPAACVSGVFLLFVMRMNLCTNDASLKKVNFRNFSAVSYFLIVVSYASQAKMTSDVETIWRW